MNLQSIAKYIILIWLPLASFEEQPEEKRTKDLLLNKIQNGDEFDQGKEELIVKQVKGGNVHHDNGASHTSPMKTSANTGVQSRESMETSSMRGKNRNAHGKIKLNRDLSALHVTRTIYSRGNKSAVYSLPDKTESQTRLKYLMGWIRRRKRRKKRALLDRRGRNQESGLNLSSFISDEEYNEEGDNDGDDNDEINLEDLDNDENDIGNSTELGRFLGSPCEDSCSTKLLHVFCDPENRICECEKKYPVQIGIGRGCAKPKQLGDQCFYAQTCSFTDPNAICMQINHNAICQCKPGFHSVALRRGAKKSFCSEDQVVVSTDLPTLLGVATGIAVLTGLICFVLKLFNNNRFPERHRYNNANIAPPLLLSSDNQWINGIPLTVHGRPSSRTSSQRSTTNLAQYSRSKGVLVPASRAGAARAAAILLIPCHLQATKPSDSEVANRSRIDECDTQENDNETFSRPGSRRPSLTSIKSTTSSQKSMSYSARRFEQENQQKEARAAMRAAREEAVKLAAPPTPSPLSTDELLPTLDTVVEDDSLRFCSSMVHSASTKSGSISEMRLSPSGSSATKL